MSVPKSNNYAVATLIPMCAENAEYFREDGTLGIYKNFDDAIRAVNMSIWALSSEVDMTNIDSIIKLYVPNNELYCYDTVRAIKSWVNWNNPSLDVALSEYDRVAGFINDCEWSLEDFNLRSWISAKCEKGGVV